MGELVDAAEVVDDAWRGRQDAVQRVRCRHQAGRDDEQLHARHADLGIWARATRCDVM